MGKTKPNRAGSQLRMTDIARISGYDVSTVSRALADSPRVNEETKQHIRKVVESTGYVVNRTARNLRSQHSGLILVMLPSIASSSFSEVVLGVEEATQSRGFNVVIGNTQYSREREEMLGRQLVSGSVDGLVLLTGRVPDCVAGIAGYERRVIAVSRPVPDHRIPSISIDNAAAARSITQFMLGLGHRGIVHLAGPLESPVFAARAASYAETMRSAGLAPRVVAAPTYDISGGKIGMSSLLSSGEPLPSAVICASDEIAFGAMQIVREAGFSVPADMSFSGFDDILFSETYAPSLTTIRIPRHELGRIGTEMLLGGLQDGKPIQGARLLDFELMIRASTRRLG